MNHECEDSDIIELISRAEREGDFDEISYEECHCTPGYYISIKKGNYSGYIRREEKPAVISREGIPTRITLLSIVKQEGKNKKQMIYIDKIPIAGTKQILKNTPATVQDLQNNYGLKDFLELIYGYFN